MPLPPKKQRSPRAPRPDPYLEGSIKSIDELYFKRFIPYKHVDMPIKDWYEILFDKPNRDITRFEAVKPFKMPGLHYVAASVKVQGLGYREIKPKDILFVRQDARNPNQVDVECFVGQGQKDHVFALTESEWGFVKLHVEERERKKK